MSQSCTLCVSCLIMEHFAQLMWINVHHWYLACCSYVTDTLYKSDSCLFSILSPVHLSDQQVGDCLQFFTREDMTGLILYAISSQLAHSTSGMGCLLKGQRGQRDLFFLGFQFSFNAIVLKRTAPILIYRLLWYTWNIPKCRIKQKDKHQWNSRHIFKTETFILK